MVVLTWMGIVLAAAAYVQGLRRWIYQGILWRGLLSIFVFFPALISLTMSFPAAYLRALPLAGVGMFFHRYGLRILLEIRLLWFTTLSVLVVQGYYLVRGVFPGP